ncbi:hypothetical protein [Bradyrhizobium sp. STM 3809]|uniref:hypothetical protein n=1 Tax=Bradyrhizobium sp. STM 3809 TaxID=551936 RepID=UPI0002409F1A|nr:hypothetical protein [Bradyrhizobium sp. STM 3809]CCE03589.1 conserved hypothetical protein [Bradyrhizobium sp. STM 3809]
MLMRTPAREKPGLGDRVRRVIERLRAHASSLTSSSHAIGATQRNSPYHVVEEEPDDSNMDVALAALIDQIERPVQTQPSRFPGLARMTTSRQAPHIPVYERPPYFDIEPRQLEPRPLEVEPRRMPAHDDPVERIVPEDELSELRKDLMSAISARLGSPEDHLATIRNLLRAVK